MTYAQAQSNDKKLTAKTTRNARKATLQETHANNYASVRVCKRMFSIGRWISFIESELEGMNKRKEGRPFEYCNTMIVWIMSFIGYTKGLTFRKAAGMASGQLSDHDIRGPDYTTIFRRITKLVKESLSKPEDERFISEYVKPKANDRKIRAAVDSTGLNLSKTTLWRKNKWGVGPDRRGWIKLHVIADIDTGEIIAYILTEENVADNCAFRQLIRLALSEGYDLRTVFADAAYEDRESWKMLHSAGIRFIVRFKSNTVAHSNGCMDRGEAAGIWVKNTYDEWKKITHYGLRWKAEVVFSDLKRLVAETISAIVSDGMIRETLTKVLAYNNHKQVRANMIGITGNEIYIADV